MHPYILSRVASGATTGATSVVEMTEMAVY
jgi:hypothetical protein